MKKLTVRVFALILTMMLLFTTIPAVFAYDYVTDSQEGTYYGYYYNAYLSGSPDFADGTLNYANPSTLRVDVIVTYGTPYLGIIYGEETFSNFARNARTCETVWRNDSMFLAVWINSLNYINGGIFMRDLEVTVDHLQSTQPDHQIQ